MKITQITLRSFRAFDEPFELDLSGGKNLLLYGENGSGKSSIYFALKRFFEERGDDIEKHRNHFSPAARASYVHVHIKGKDATGNDHDQEFKWDATNGHPLPIPKPSAKAPLAPDLRALLVDGARRSGFVDYRMMLRTHFLSNPLPRSNRGPKIHDIIYGAETTGLERQLFDLASLAILAGVRVPASGGETTIGTLMRSVWENRPQTRLKVHLDKSNAYTNAFNQSFNAKLPELNDILKEFLDCFENHQLTIKFGPVSLAWDKRSLELIGAELTPEITFRSKPIADYHLFLNEARLSALAACMFFAGVRLSDNDYGNSAYPRFMVLDDALIGLDLENRLPILRILSSAAFKQYQIFLFTYDRVWFDIACGHLPVKDGWLHKELLAEEKTGALIPILKPSQGDLERAKKHLTDGDLKAAAVYARSAFEWKLRSVCEKNHIMIPFQRNPDRIGAGQLWDGLVSLQRGLDRKGFIGEVVPDFLPPNLETAVETMRSTVLNQLSHAGAPGLVRAEVAAAITTVENMFKHNFPQT